MPDASRGPTITSTAITHYGEWNEESRKVPALLFFERYDAMVQACDFSGPYHDWFAPSANFYTNAGATYHSGTDLWNYMKSPTLFGNYEKAIPQDRISTVIINGHEKGDRLIHQQVMVFYPREGKKKGVGIPVRRTIEFVSGPSEVAGQGTNGLQYYIGKTFWDTNVLAAGNNFAVNLLIPSAQVVIIGTTKAYSSTAASGNTTKRYFCPECGSPVCTVVDTKPDLTFVKGGLFRKAGFGLEPPFKEQWCRRSEAWEVAYAPKASRSQ
ncbi:hypothetical protein LTR56_001503 [Elasticomyces elasticus]|nr:hypothetical protein LTR56_001503 [Elasticomyces elasticus]KAK3668575.1 hypothetical protein LTR22_000462 [Elasticomyces elasticus]KAK4931927.1 hypothetical protein LTR49_001614 [Elasticomyces elasticus]KAK5768542.1 hypothetical protein LTS12_001330 [Elasticomyces elasticus]